MGGESSRKLRAGPVTDQPNRLRTPPGVGTPLQAVGRPGQCHPRRKFCSSVGERETSKLGRSIDIRTVPSRWIPRSSGEARNLRRHPPGECHLGKK